MDDQRELFEDLGGAEPSRPEGTRADAWERINLSSLGRSGGQETTPKREQVADRHRGQEAAEARQGGSHPPLPGR